MNMMKTFPVLVALLAKPESQTRPVNPLQVNADQCVLIQVEQVSLWEQTLAQLWFHLRIWLRQSTCFGWFMSHCWIPSNPKRKGKKYPELGLEGNEVLSSL